VFLPWPAELPPTSADPMGDGVAETLMLREFAAAIRQGRPPDQDVYFGLSCRSPGSRRCAPAWPTVSRWGVPDLRRPEVRATHAADNWFPDLPEL
jgi:hypothetical protein